MHHSEYVGVLNEAQEALCHVNLLLRLQRHDVVSVRELPVRCQVEVEQDFAVLLLVLGLKLLDLDLLQVCDQLDEVLHVQISIDVDVSPVKLELIDEEALDLAAFDRGLGDIRVAEDDGDLSPDDVVCAAEPRLGLETGGDGLEARIVALELVQGAREGDGAGSWIYALEDGLLEVSDDLDALEFFAPLLDAVDEDVVVQSALSLRQQTGERWVPPGVQGPLFVFALLLGSLARPLDRIEVRWALRLVLDFLLDLSVKAGLHRVHQGIRVLALQPLAGGQYAAAGEEANVVRVGVLPG